MKVQKPLFACLFFLLLSAPSAFAAPVAEAAAPYPEAARDQVMAAASMQPTDVFKASILSGGDCSAASRLSATSEDGGFINCGNCSSLACRGLYIGDYCGHTTTGPKFCLDAYEGAVCPAEDGIRCLCARELP
jgi:hypothetical protein